jgi:hypothetical protein
MKFGVREICDVVLKTKSAGQKIGNTTFENAGMPVLYFDTLKTSSMEGAATTVYAQGGRGNSRLVAWEGERTVTFTMEDALISPLGFMILSGAGLIEASSKNTITVHATEQIVCTKAGELSLGEEPSSNSDATIYVMKLDGNGEICEEPAKVTASGSTLTVTGAKASDVYLVDYYVDRTSKAQQIEITPDKFGGNYYLEASTLFRNTDGVDMPAEFVIPNCKVQSNFTFTMASSGDPSSFTFTLDAFPDYTKFDKTKKVLAAIQILEEAANED